MRVCNWMYEILYVYVVMQLPVFRGIAMPFQSFQATPRYWQGLIIAEQQLQLASYLVKNTLEKAEQLTLIIQWRLRVSMKVISVTIATVASYKLGQQSEFHFVCKQAWEQEYSSYAIAKNFRRQLYSQLTMIGSIELVQNYIL